MVWPAPRVGGNLMFDSYHALEAEALKLPPGDRARLATRLFRSLGRDPEVEAAWEEEIHDRVASADAGALGSVSAGILFAEARRMAKDAGLRPEDIAEAVNKIRDDSREG